MSRGDAKRARERRPTLSVAEAAALLGISRNHAFKAVQRGDLPSVRVGRRILIPVDRLSVFLGAVDGGSPDLSDGHGA